MYDPSSRSQYFDGSTNMIGDENLLAGRYRLLQKVGEGGAAEVFRARDERLDRIVAIKLLRPQFMSDPQSRSRFVTEARAAAGLMHPGIVDVYDFGEAPGGTMFMAMRYIEGQDLKEVLAKRGRLLPAEAIDAAVQVCHALSAAHANGLIHRDVKPQNIMIDRGGVVRLTDFGVVKALSGPALTQSGMTFGTAAYLSPEQATGATIGPASDIYALGCVIYEMLAGTPPFVGDNPAVVAYKQVWDQPRPLHDLVPDVPPSLEAVVMRCLNKDPNRRYPTAETLAADLEKLSAASNQPTQAVKLGPAVVPGGDGQTGPISPSERSQAIAMPLPPGEGQGVPPVRVQTTGYGAAGAPHVSQPAPVQQQETAPMAVRPLAPAAAYAGPQRQTAAPTVNVNRRRGIGWVPLAIVALVGLGLCGFAAYQGRNLAGFAGLGGKATPSAATPTQRVEAHVPTPTQLGGGIAYGSQPTATPAPAATDTQVPPQPTNTPPPQDTATPEPTETPQPPLPTVTAAPEATTPPEPTNTPEAQPPPPQGGTSVTLDDTQFSGGYTRTDGHYHGRTARWVYGQGTQYSTMTAHFKMSGGPVGSASLAVVGVDSEDLPKTPIRITINGAVIYEGPDPLPNDLRTGPNGPGNWGSQAWEFDPTILHDGDNTLSIINLDPSDKVNYPLFFMLDYATVSWGP